jgi:hypothetical protein
MDMMVMNHQGTVVGAKADVLQVAGSTKGPYTFA